MNVAPSRPPLGRHEHIVAAMQRVLPSLRPTTLRRWAARRGHVELELRLSEHWLDLAVAPADAAPRSAAEWLAANAALPAIPKLAAAPDGRVRLTASLPLDGAVFGERLGHAARTITGTLDGGDAAIQSVPVCDAAALRALVVGAGWPLIEARDGWRVEIDCGGMVLLADVAAGSGGVVAQLDLPALAAATAPRCRAAVAELLWRVNGRLRLARLSLHDDRGTAQPRITAALHGAPGQSDVAHLLAALAVAARHCALEVEALAADPRLAELYLAHGTAGAGIPINPAPERRRLPNNSGA